MTFHVSLVNCNYIQYVACTYCGTGICKLAVKTLQVMKHHPRYSLKVIISSTLFDLL